MKKKFFAMAGLLFIGSGALHAQSSYAEFGFGYGYQLAPVEMDYNTIETHTDIGTTTEDEVVKGSFGQGMNLGVRYGYMFSPWIGIDLGVNYLLSSKMKASYVYNENYTSTGYYSSTANVEYKGDMIKLNPSVILMQDNGTVSPFARVGLVLGYGSVRVSYSESDSEMNTWSYKMLVDGGAAFGMSADIGIKYLLAGNISFVGSLNFTSMTYSPKHGEITSWVENGVEYISGFTTYDREVDYLKSVTHNTAADPDPNQPYQDTKFYLPYGSIGLNIGLHFDL